MSSRDRSVLRSLTAALHGLAGRASFGLGRCERARRHFERVLEIKGDDFSAYVHLGRLAYKLGDYAGWRRECGHAHRTSPERYARLKHPFELFEPRAGTADEEAGSAAWRTFRIGQVVHGVEGSGTAPASGPRNCSGGSVRRFGDDFCSDAEREKFRDLEPIEATELARIDLDDLSERLGG